MLFPLNGNQAGLYMRLSRDEDATRESNSIVNQRKILTDFASKNGFVVVDEYVDDGYSGANFRRPAFEKMLEDARNRRIDVVIVKDLSRLGRDYIGTGEYMEKIFPRLGVRFIAIADGYDGRDNEDPSADMMPMINFFNEYHSKQTSKKTRASKKVMAQAGKFIGTKAPYGYLLDPADKHHLLIDPEAAKVVKAIFRYACSGLGYKAIVRRLRDKGKSYCRSHYISFDELQRLVLEDVRRTAWEAVRILDGRLDEVERAAEKQAERELVKKEAAWSKARARMDKLAVRPRRREQSVAHEVLRACGPHRLWTAHGQFCYAFA